MYAQLIRGRVVDGQAAATRFSCWPADVGSAAPGWRDLTGGVTASGELLSVVRFASEDDARANAARDEQHRWWNETRGLLLGEATVCGSGDVTELWEGTTGQAGFVQMMLATVADRATVEDIEAELDDAFRRWRPDAIGGYRVWFPERRMLAVDYFSSEAEARAGEQREPPPEIAEGFPRWMAQMSNQEWFDIPAPWLAA